MSEWELYWLLKLDSVRYFLIFCSMGLAVSTFVCFVQYLVEGASEGLALAKVSGAALLLLASVATLMPTTKQMATIYVLPPIINNEKVQEIPEQLLDLLDLSIDKAKEKLKEDTKKAIEEST